MNNIEKLLENLSNKPLTSLFYPMGSLLNDLKGTDLEELLKPWNPKETNKESNSLNKDTPKKP